MSGLAPAATSEGSRTPVTWTCWSCRWPPASSSTATWRCTRCCSCCASGACCWTRCCWGRLPGRRAPAAAPPSWACAAMRPRPACAASTSSGTRAGWHAALHAQCQSCFAIGMDAQGQHASYGRGAASASIMCQGWWKQAAFQLCLPEGCHTVRRHVGFADAQFGAGQCTLQLWDAAGRDRARGPHCALIKTCLQLVFTRITMPAQALPRAHAGTCRSRWRTSWAAACSTARCATGHAQPRRPPRPTTAMQTASSCPTWSWRPYARASRRWRATGSTRTPRWASDLRSNDQMACSCRFHAWHLSVWRLQQRAKLQFQGTDAKRKSLCLRHLMAAITYGALVWCLWHSNWWGLECHAGEAGALPWSAKWRAICLRRWAWHTCPSACAGGTTTSESPALTLTAWRAWGIAGFETGFLGWQASSAECSEWEWRGGWHYGLCGFSMHWLIDGDFILSSGSDSSGLARLRNLLSLMELWAGQKGNWVLWTLTIWQHHAQPICPLTCSVHVTQDSRDSFDFELHCWQARMFNISSLATTDCNCTTDSICHVEPSTSSLGQHILGWAWGCMATSWGTLSRVYAGIAEA